MKHAGISLEAEDEMWGQTLLSEATKLKGLHILEFSGNQPLFPTTDQIVVLSQTLQLFSIPDFVSTA